MFTTEVTACGRTSFENLDRSIEWERAAHILDLDPSMVRRLHKPHMECVSRYECTSGAASLYVAAGPRNCGETLAMIALESGIGARDVCERERELRVEVALSEVHEDSAAIGVQLPSAATEEEIWELARQCAPIVSRVLGKSRFVPRDLPSSVFANWMAHEAAQYGIKLDVPKMDPEKYCSQLHQLAADSSVQLTAMGLQEKCKQLRCARATIVGLDRVSGKCMQTMHDLGMLIVGVADESGALIRKEGIDVPPLLRHLMGGGLLAEYTEAEHAMHSEALAVNADVVLLGGPGNEITESNSASVRASMVIEGWHRGLDSDACDALNERSVLVVPKRLTRYLQVVEDFIHPRPDGGAQRQRGELLKRLWREMAMIRERHGIGLPTAALALALRRLAEEERTSHP